MEDVKVLMAVVNTLNTISVCGKTNCDKMAGCIKAVESVISAINTETEKLGSALSEEPSAEEANG